MIGLTLWITALIMFAGGTAILLMAKRRSDTESLAGLSHGIVPIIAGCLYVAMATGQGAVVLPTDAALAGINGTTRIFWFGRYIDWTFTTPLLLVSLSLLGTFRGRKRADLIVGAIIADVIMIATAFAFSASEGVIERWLWFALSCVAFLGVYYVIWVSQREASTLEATDVQTAYQRNALFLSVVWLVYPVILALSPDGLGILGDAVCVPVIAVTDVIAKVVYGFVGLRDDAKLASL